ncbi:uroporphyrinogen-III C-methyltransferase [Silanimonas sp.]|uniref:uroporphyrinogen-III C-methyltransferase n=1 Tax=Silanimonas sp. TaxID=1929290 RepID=UPI001BC59121|nr:uroporphyrinogen-III C-methyltransferase [Silanimonas sp.]MBS3896833.1 uroporphyrinogen-III C-methyltransferase [Silanimonas sp.]
MDRTVSLSYRPWFALLLLLAVLLPVLGWWVLRPAPQAVADPFSPQALDQRLLAVEQALTALQRGQQRSEQRLADVEARSIVLRDEVLGLGQRAALIEDSVQQAMTVAGSDPGVSLRLDEIDLLLTHAEARLELSGDIDGARRAYALADGLLAALTAPQFVNLRQSLAQEQAALAALPPDPRTIARGRVDAVEAALAELPVLPEPPPTPADAPVATRLLAALVDVRPRGTQDLLAPADRQRGEAALRLELALARIAIERRDELGLIAASTRAERWMRRLYAAGPPLEAQAVALQALGQTPLALDVPVLGSTLAQMRALRRGGGLP